MDNMKVTDEADDASLIAQGSQLKGDVTVGKDTVIHSEVVVSAETGPIIIGENNTLQRGVQIINRSQISEENHNSSLVVGVNNIFQFECEIHARNIGDFNVFEAQCYVGPEVEIGNGCIIGKGCRITGRVKLEDNTVISGLPPINNTDPDTSFDPDDMQRQQDEVTVMGEIFTGNEYTYCTTEAGHFTVFNMEITLPEKFILSLSRDLEMTEDLIRHLPPIRLSAFLPKDYPSMCSPEFTVSCSWLGVEHLNQIRDELKKQWEENQSEILFIWNSYLKYDALNTLDLKNHYNLNEKLQFGRDNLKEHHSFKQEVKSCNMDGSSSHSDANGNEYALKDNRNNPPANVYTCNNEVLCEVERKNQDILKQHQEKIIKQLYVDIIEYNAKKCTEEFIKTQHDCNVCFCTVMGHSCILLPCKHITCVECLERMCQVHIQHGSVDDILCSEENCGLEIPVSVIKGLLTEELFMKYDKLMVKKALDKMNNVVYCPLRHCQAPVIVDLEESLAICGKCNHAFCIYCKRTYHGIENCRLKGGEQKEIVQLYKTGDRNKRLELEKRYGKKQLTKWVTEAETEAWLAENGKQCPCCNVFIEKNSGCNKMFCEKCRATFCWLCLTRLPSFHPYLHYSTPNTPCFNALYQGLTEDELNDLQIYEDWENPDVFDGFQDDIPMQLEALAAFQMAFEDEVQGAQQIDVVQEIKEEPTIETSQEHKEMDVAQEIKEEEKIKRSQEHKENHQNGEIRQNNPNEETLEALQLEALQIEELQMIEVIQRSLLEY